MVLVFLGIILLLFLINFSIDCDFNRFYSKPPHNRHQNSSLLPSLLVNLWQSLDVFRKILTCGSTNLHDEAAFGQQYSTDGSSDPAQTGNMGEVLERQRSKKKKLSFLCLQGQSSGLSGPVKADMSSLHETGLYAG